MGFGYPSVSKSHLTFNTEGCHNLNNDLTFFSERNKKLKHGMEKREKMRGYEL
jgi:hypothetical protein